MRYAAVIAVTVCCEYVIEIKLSFTVLCIYLFFVSDKENRSTVESVMVNRNCYFTNAVKKATYATDTETAAVKYEVRNASTDAVVSSGTATPKGYDADAGEYVQIIDFTDVTKDGEYYIWVDDTSNVWTNPKTNEKFDMYKSHVFQVGNYSYDGMLRDALNYYYQNRSGVDIEAAYITSGNKTTLAHQGGHYPKDMA